MGSTGEDTFGINQYLIYTLNDCIAFGSRQEWWKADGVSFYESTFGLNIRHHANFVVRPEYRKDWAPGIGYEEDSFGVDIIMTF